MFGLPKRFVLFDLECTTWEGAVARNWSGPGEHREVVQAGVALVNEQFIPLVSYSAIIKPVVNPVLSQYFIDLTGISQERVNREGIDFPNFLRSFREFVGHFELYCFDSRMDGSRLFDRDVLIENCKLLKLRFPFRKKRFHNVNKVFVEHGYAIKQSGAAPEAFGIEPPARSHDALNDVNGLLIALKALSERTDG